MIQTYLYVLNILMRTKWSKNVQVVQHFSDRRCSDIREVPTFYGGNVTCLIKLKCSILNYVCCSLQMDLAY